MPRVLAAGILPALYHHCLLNPNWSLPLLFLGSSFFINLFQHVSERGQELFLKDFATLYFAFHCYVSTFSSLLMSNVIVEKSIAQVIHLSDFDLIVFVATPKKTRSLY